VIPSANPSATNQQVTDYLTSNKITWQTSAEAPPPPLNLDKSQEVSASKLQQVRVQQMPSAASTSAPTAQLVTESLENSPTPGGATGQFILTRQLPRQQAMELGDALENLTTPPRRDFGAAAATQPAILKDENPAVAPTTQPVAMQNFKMLSHAPTTQPRRIAAGDTLSIRVPQLVGPGIEPQSTQQVASGGTVSLPMVDPISVAGMSESQAAEMISRKYRDAKLIPNATATVTIATTQPVAESSAPSGQTAATSQPSAADLVDVVIVVKQQSASPSTQPTTQPATTQPTPQVQSSPIKK
jgi:hypothetical protein